MRAFLRANILRYLTSTLVGECIDLLATAEGAEVAVRIITDFPFCPSLHLDCPMFCPSEELV